MIFTIAILINIPQSKITFQIKFEKYSNHPKHKEHMRLYAIEIQR